MGRGDDFSNRRSWLKISAHLPWSSLGSVHTWCPGTVSGFYSTPGTNVNTPFFWYPRQNSGTVPVPEYMVSTLYSGTKLGTESLCEHIFRWCPGTLPTNHLFSYPQFLVPLEISIVSVCSVYWMWTYLQTGYRVSEHSTILCRCPGTSARAPSVNTALEAFWYRETLSKNWWRRQRERGWTKDLMSRKIAQHVRLKTVLISLPSSTKQQRQITKIFVVLRRTPRWQIV